MLLKTSVAIFIAVALAVVGCSKKEKTEETEEATQSTIDMNSTPSDEPRYVVVQHILIGFDGSIPGKDVNRTQEEAAELAASIFARVQGGEDFDQLVRDYTDDSYPGIYKMANFGVEGDMEQAVFPRAQMVRAFGDVGFPLEVGEVGLAEYDPQSSKYGWHIIKRIE